MKNYQSSHGWSAVKLLLVLSVLIVCFTFAAHADDISANEFNWDSWFKETALPMAFAFLSAAAVNYLETLPLMNKIKNASGKFELSASNVNAVVEATLMHEKQITAEREEFKKQIEAYEEKIKQMYDQQLESINAFLAIAQGYDGNLKGAEERIITELQKAVHSSEKTEKMVYLGFTNQCEMVQNGCARKIAEVEEEIAHEP